MTSLQIKSGYEGYEEKQPSPPLQDNSQINDSSATPLKPTWKQFLMTWGFTVCATLWIIFTIFFAYNSTLSNPFSTSLIPSKPNNTIAALAVLSHVTVFLLQMITSSVFEAVRWAYASSRGGISAFAFVALSRATGIHGVADLVIHDSKTNEGFTKGHRFWGSQRFGIYSYILT